MRNRFLHCLLLVICLSLLTSEKLLCQADLQTTLNWISEKVETYGNHESVDQYGQRHYYRSHMTFQGSRVAVTVEFKIGDNGNWHFSSRNEYNLSDMKADKVQFGPVDNYFQLFVGGIEGCVKQVSETGETLGSMVGIIINISNSDIAQRLAKAFKAAIEMCKTSEPY